MTPLFLLAPGAGAPVSSRFLVAWKERLATLGRVEAFDYPYMQGRRRRPDPQPLLIAAHADALAKARKGHAGPVFLAGKSMGSRIGCHVSLSEPVTGLVCLGYPLRSPSGSVRDAVLVQLSTPILFVQGTRDDLCPLDLLAEVRTRMQAPSEQHVVEGGDHSLAVTKTALKAAGVTQEDVDRRIFESIAQFVAAHS